MNVERLHHRLAVGMALAGLTAAWGGGVLGTPVAVAGLSGLIAALVWRPREPHPWLERALLVAAVLLAVRAAYLAVVSPEARLIGMVDVLLLLLVGEVWKSAGRVNDIRIYVLSFALLLAATVFRPGLVFGVSFVVYVMLSTVALMVGHLRRKTRRYGAREVTLGRRFLLGTGALSLVTLAISVMVFLAFPRVSRGWAPGGPASATRIAGFADRVSLDAHGATIETNPEVVLRVEFPGGRPTDLSGLYWRGRSYDRFDGVRWLHSEQIPRSGPSTDWYDRRWQGPRIRQEIYGSLLDSRVLFALHPVVDVDARNRVRPYQDPTGDLRFFGSRPPHYAAESVLDDPTPAALRAEPSGRAPARRHYLQLPELSPRVTALADSLIAGHGTRYDRARSIERWLRGMTYTRTLPPTAAEATLEHFLFERQAGHCEYFSTAMVVLLRSVGIPARNVNGFLGGQWNAVGSHLAVTQNEAHSWVEVWHPGFGWVTYDPTPASRTAGDGSARAFWPGRILLDGLRHRWNKWVLDYSMQNQEGFLRRATEILDSDRADGGDGRPDIPAWLIAVAVAVFVGGLIRIALYARSGTPPATRLYLRLRRAYDGHGFDAIPRGAPLRFAASVDAASVPGAPHAVALVRQYVRLRFGGDAPTAGRLASMRDELRAARRALRRG